MIDRIQPNASTSASSTSFAAFMFLSISILFGVAGGYPVEPLSRKQTYTKGNSAASSQPALVFPYPDDWTMVK